MMRRKIEEESERHWGAGSLFLLAVTLGLGTMISWNALFGQGPLGPGTLLALGVPEGASTHMDVVAKTDGQNTITLRYDANVEAVQQELKQAGFYAGVVDGVAGSRTRDAVIAWQRSAGLEPTGTIDPDLVDHIRYTRRVAEAAQPTNSITPATADNPPLPHLSDTARIMQAQAALAALGYGPGAPDGAMKNDTRAAILKFEMDRGLAMDGVVTDRLLAELTKPAPTAP